MGKNVYFTHKLFDFLLDLKTHNNREWFHANKERYESAVRDPMLRFITDFRRHLHTISKNFKTDPRPVGGSMFRLQRDIRFSKDKSPYKINAAAHFPHQDCGKDVHAPGFYLHIEPGNSMGGGGIWHPDIQSLSKIRKRIAEYPKEWRKIWASGITIEGESLKRPPQGYDDGHPLIEDIKRKDFYTMKKFTDKEICSHDFMDMYTESCRSIAPLVKFLANSIELRW